MSFVGFGYYHRDWLPVPTHPDYLYALTRRQPMFVGLLMQGQGRKAAPLGAAQAKSVSPQHAHIHKMPPFHWSTLASARPRPHTQPIKLYAHYNFFLSFIIILLAHGMTNLSPI